MSVIRGLKRFLADEKGLEPVEYALMLVLLGLVAVVGAYALGQAVSRKYTAVGTAVDDAAVPTLPTP